MENTTKTPGKNVEEPKAGEPVVQPEVKKSETKTPEVKKSETKTPEVKKSVVKASEVKKPEETKPSKSVLKNVFGKEVPQKDYFYKGIVPAGFLGTCGAPVDREELLDVFNKVFKPEDNILFYRQPDKEVYIVIIPIKYSTEIGDFNNSFEGDFQKHAISFLTEGSVNPDTLRQKLEKINSFVKYSDR